MSVDLYSQFGTQIAYPSAAFEPDDYRSMLGLYSFGGAITPSTVVSAIGYVAITMRERDGVAVTMRLRDDVEVTQ